MRRFVFVLLVGVALHGVAQEPTASSGEPIKLPVLTWQGTGCKGEELSVLMGCPFDQDSPFVMRVRLEKGLRLPAHSYPIDIGVTVIDGVLEVTFPEGEKKRTVTMKGETSSRSRRTPYTPHTSLKRPSCRTAASARSTRPGNMRSASPARSRILWFRYARAGR